MVSCVISHYALEQNSLDSSEDVKTKCYVIVISCAEAFLFLVLTFTLFFFYYYVDNPHETYNYVLNGSSPHRGNQLNLKGFLFNL